MIKIRQASITKVAMTQITTICKLLSPVIG
jgi:hypothetical protein